MTDYDVAIVGGGPAGLVATRYALHAHLRTAILTPELGGKVNYPFAIRGIESSDTVWGANLVHDFEQHVDDSARLSQITQVATQIQQTASGEFQIHLADRSHIQATAVIVTTGATPQRLYVPGEKEYWGRGVSFSAISHAPLFRARDVAVIGGDNRALMATLELAQLANRVHLIAAHRNMMVDLPEAGLVRKQPNVSVFSDWEVQAMVGDEYLTGIHLVGVNGETRHLAVDGVFVQFSLLPNNDMVRGLVEMDEEGHICVNCRCETNIPGLFAAGDVTNIHAEQVLVAVGEGAKAALSAWEYIAVHQASR